jgi:hypothetical protein
MSIISNVAGMVRASSQEPKERTIISLGGMKFNETALFHNLIAFGAEESGKTASVVYPILDSVTRLYNNEDPTAPDAKWGGLVLDSTQDLQQILIYLMQKRGRDPLTDLVVLRPETDYRVLEFEETTTGKRFFVSWTGSGSESECDLVLARATGSKDVLGQDSRGDRVLLLSNGGQESLCSALFSGSGKFRSPEIHQLLSRLEFDLEGLQVRWLGWREFVPGELTRVTSTQNRQPEVATSEGTPITTEAPKRLRYLGVHSLHSGLAYRLIPNRLNSVEAAGRLVQAAEAISDALRPENGYWLAVLEKHIGYCIELFRRVERFGCRQCGVSDVLRLTLDEDLLKEHLNKFETVIRQKQETGASDQEILLLRNLKDYFVEEWMTMNPANKRKITRSAERLFGQVTETTQVLPQICRRPEIDLTDCLSDGKVYVLAAGGSHPDALKLVGTCLKLDFQQAVMQRIQPGDLNKQRFLMLQAHDYQHFITTSGPSARAGGDEKFLSVSRQNRVFNFMCVPGVSSLLSAQQQEPKVAQLLACFGCRIFLRNLDQGTNELAKETGGQTAEGQSRFEASVFTEMEPLEAVVFNKGARAGKQMLRADLRPDAKFYAHDNVRAAANDYYRALVENRVHELGIPSLFDAVLKEESDGVIYYRQEGVLQSWRNGGD